MGLPIDASFVKAVVSGELDRNKSPEYLIVESFFELPLATLPKEALERYAELSTKTTYIPFLPHNEKL